MKILSLEGFIKLASFRNKYDLLSNSISRKIFEVIKQSYQNRTSFKDSFYEKQDNEEYTIDFLVKYLDKKDLKANIDAMFFYPDGISEPYITLKIYIGPTFSQQDLERFHWNLYEAIRHEYEHFDKYVKGFYPDEEHRETMDKLDSFGVKGLEKAKLISKYILNNIEIDSYARSIVYVAKKRKIPYGNVIDDILDRALYGNNEDIKIRMMKNKEVCKIAIDIKSRLVKRIQEIFPAISLKDSF